MIQEEIILNHLQEHGEITAWEAITEHHITRCSEMIRRLRVKGYNIESVRVSKKRGRETVNFVRYRLK